MDRTEDIRKRPGWLDRLFKVGEKGSSVRVEIGAGVTTFLTMAYIIFLNPSIISTDFAGKFTGLSVDAALFATCLAAFVSTVLMGIIANLPIAQAPGMGENIFFVTVTMALSTQGVAQAWQVTLGIVFVSGILFLLLSVLKVRKIIIDSVSPSLRNAIAVGIGLFIAFIGLQNAGIILPDPVTAVRFNSDIVRADVLIFLAGLLVTSVLYVRRVRGALILGVLLTTVLSLIAGKVQFTGVFGLPKDQALFKLDIVGALKLSWIPFILVFLFMDMFDTVGTLIGVAEQGNLMKDNQLPGANRVLLSDAIGTVVGACSGTSTVTSFIESAAGIEYGGRTGLASVVTGTLFLVALFFSPLVGMVGKYLPITSPALVIVGSMMVRNVKKIDWADYSEAIPAFLVIMGIPLSYNIHDGLAMGFISYPIIKLAGGRIKDLNWFMGVVAIIFILRYVLIRF